MIWNIRYGFDNNGWQSFDRIVDMINNTGWYRIVIILVPIVIVID